MNRFYLCVFQYFPNKTMSGSWDFPGSLMIKTLPSSAGGAGLIPGQESRSHMPHDQKKTKQPFKKKKRKEKTSNIVTNLTKTLKTVHTKKTLQKNKRSRVLDTLAV